MIQCYRKPQAVVDPLIENNIYLLSVFICITNYAIRSRFGCVNVTLKSFLEWGVNRLYKSSASRVVNVPS